MLKQKKKSLQHFDSNIDNTHGVPAIENNKKKW